MKLLRPDPKHITLSSDWKYVTSSKTDIRKTFKRERDRLVNIEMQQKSKPNKVRELRVK